ncbi:MAG: hypothetical protein ACD_78C00283G0001 [uncultured bacterium (gcode 4)]|uniref:Uncharacterized protein n=1 Tax=uncultured bacterium (gcode 4) TaxID=1234023 RepID=K1XHG0_9BACT|nr:MAG: hypothetical protein ACD_78C00283G0001 [uncultured bacterium (gcode 4)]
MRVLKVIPHKRPSDTHEIGRSRDELRKNPPRRWESIDEEIERLKHIRLTRTVRSDEDIFLSPDKRHRFVVFKGIESEGCEHEVILWFYRRKSNIFLNLLNVIYHWNVFLYRSSCQE